MSDVAISIQQQQPTRQQLAAQGRSAPGKVTGRLKVALHAMVWEGLKRAEAAAKAGLAEHSLYVALSRPHVRAYYLAQLDVLRTSARARNIHVLEEVRDQVGNQMARVQAVKALEQLSDEQHSVGGSVASPGICIIIGNAAQPAPVTVHERSTDANPLIDNSTGRGR